MFCVDAIFLLTHQVPSCPILAVLSQLRAFEFKLHPFAGNVRKLLFLGLESTH
jgi:hypothetical protein